MFLDVLSAEQYVYRNRNDNTRNDGVGLWRSNQKLLNNFL